MYQITKKNCKYKMVLWECRKVTTLKDRIDEQDAYEQRDTKIRSGKELPKNEDSP